MKKTFPPPTPPVIGGIPANHSGAGNHPITRVVVHSAVMDNRPGAARMLGAWNRNGTTGGSWHYAVDADDTYQCSYDRFVCWHAPPNGHSIGVEMADRPVPGAGRPGLAGRAAWLRTIARWQTPRHRRMLRRTAHLVAELLLAYDLPPVMLTPAGCRAGRRGIATHATVSAAFGQSSHWDPGAWPERRFVRLVRRHYNHKKEAQ